MLQVTFLLFKLPWTGPSGLFTFRINSEPVVHITWHTCHACHIVILKLAHEYFSRQKITNFYFKYLARSFHFILQK